jgi:hypothetical protein
VISLGLPRGAPASLPTIYCSFATGIDGGHDYFAESDARAGDTGFNPLEGRREKPHEHSPQMNE